VYQDFKGVVGWCNQVKFPKPQPTQRAATVLFVKAVVVFLDGELGQAQAVAG
jgi:hypothetical protein